MCRKDLLITPVCVLDASKQVNVVKKQTNIFSNNNTNHIEEGCSWTSNDENVPWIHCFSIKSFKIGPRINFKLTTNLDPPNL